MYILISLEMKTLYQVFRKSIDKYCMYITNRWFFNNKTKKYKYIINIKHIFSYAQNMNIS